MCMAFYELITVYDSHFPVISSMVSFIMHKCLIGPVFFQSNYVEKEFRITFSVKQRLGVAVILLLKLKLYQQVNIGT